ncbi:MAG: SAM-dependent methyltransferase [Nitrospirae bacterium]|nr:SAM-dependent methyltransferase [Nitrospirota bacterium]
MLNDADHEPELIALIGDEIARHGPMTFARFMDVALYAPGLGYYMRDAERIGARGDYYTSSSLHPLFGEMIARQIEEMAGCCGGTFTVIEQGAGKGALAYDILFALDQVPSLGERVAYLIVERSPAMRDRQRRLLEPWATSGRVRWAEALPTSPIRGCVVSNELVDAFPVHRVLQQNGRVAELYVGMSGEGFADVVGPPSTPELEAYLRRIGVTLAEGQQAEINLAAVEWIRQVGRALARGFVLTVDYGYPADELYAPHRKRGTLLAYFKHRTNEAFYERIGRQDLTAHVDWTTLVLAGQDVGLDVTGWTDQTSFLLGLGAAAAAEAHLAAAADEAERKRTLAGIRGLLDPRDMGRAFQVLIQHKGLTPPRLRCLAFGSSPQALFRES